MIVALTGVTGHLGAAVLRELHRRNYEIKVLVRGEDLRSIGNIPVEIIKGDVLHPESLHNLMQGCDVIIHCAAVISVNGDPTGLVYRTNVDGTRNVMEAAKDSGIRRVVYVGSIHAYRQLPDHQLLDETRVQVGKHASAYDRSKRTGQEIALAMNQHGPEVVVMNPTGIIGPFDFKPSRSGQMILDLVTGRLSFVIRGGFDFCDSRDVAHAVVNGLTQGSPGECYVLSGKWVSLRDIVSMLSECTRNRIRVFTIPPVLAKAGLPIARLQGWIGRKEPLYTHEALEAILTGNKCISSKKAMRDLNYQPRPLNETLRDTVHWFQEAGFIRYHG